MLKFYVDYDLYLYRDNSCLVLTGNNMQTIENILHQNVKQIKPSFWEEITKSMVFGSKQKLRDWIFRGTILY